MTKEVTRKPKPKPGDGITGLEALSSGERSMERLEAAENNELHVGAVPPVQQRQFNPNLTSAAPGTRDRRFDGLRGEERIAAAVEIGGLASIGQDMGLDEDTTLGEVERLRMSGADGISGMEDNPEVQPEITQDINRVNREWYDGHRVHVTRTIGSYFGQTIIADFTAVGDNDEEFNEGFADAVDLMLAKLTHPLDPVQASTAEVEHSGLVAERLFRHWRTLGGSFDLISVGSITEVKARPGANWFGTLFLSFLGGLGALCFLIAALYVFGPYLPPLTN